jgi:hypothetical protein
MYKFLSSLVGIFLAGAISIGYAATVGNPPTPATGPGLVDGTWLNGIAGGNNVLSVFGITVTGSTSATALQLTPGFRLYQVDTAPTSNGAVNLPLCSAGADVTVINNASNTIFVFPSLLVNTLTATQDTLDGVNSAGGAINITVTSAAEFYCARNGKWFH